MAQTPYEILGVAKDATADTIRKTYRKLARKHHPDVNPGDKKAEERFKDISTAYETLSDEKKRAAYDAEGAQPPPRSYQQWQDARAQRSSRFDDGPSEFDFSELFNRARGPAAGGDLHATVQLDFRQAVEGAEVALELPGQGTVRVRIPPGADTGSVIRLAGRGQPGTRGGPAGDLVLETEVAPHPWLRREGLDLYLTLPVTLDEAYNGGSVEVPTFDGPVMLKIPARTQTGAKLRLRGKGIARKDTRGDLFAVLDVRMPDKADDALATALRASATAYANPVRKELAL